MKLHKEIITGFVLCVMVTGVFAVGGDYDYSSKVEPSQKPPNGFSPVVVPQFIVLGLDDNMNSAGVKWILDYIENEKNPTTAANNPATYDGEQITVSFYSNSIYFGGQLNAQLNRAYDLGCEVSNHTVNHIYCLDPNTSSRKSLDAVKSDVHNCNLALNNIGIANKDIKGFRTPYLAYTDTTFTVLKDLGFTYDCSVEEGNEWGLDNMVAGNYFWPYTLDFPAPGNDKQYCWWNETYDAPIRIHEGLWELPCYLFEGPPDEKCVEYGIDQGFIKYLDDLLGYETEGKITGLDHNLWADTDEGGVRLNKAQTLAVLKYTLDQVYVGNRTPMTIGMHSQFYSSNSGVNFPNMQNIQDRVDVMEDFLDYALDETKFPDVRMVSGTKAIKWCMNPVALDNTAKNTNINSTSFESPVIGIVNAGQINVTTLQNGVYTLSLYSMKGSLIQTIHKGYLSRGQSIVKWNGSDLARQLYLVRFEGLQKKSVKKVFLK